ncbi:hypothetical protein CVT24_006570, partial [Panaeolus cyanescens]
HLQNATGFNLKNSVKLSLSTPDLRNRFQRDGPTDHHNFDHALPITTLDDASSTQYQRPQKLRRKRYSPNQSGHPQIQDLAASSQISSASPRPSRDHPLCNSSISVSRPLHTRRSTSMDTPSARDINRSAPNAQSASGTPPTTAISSYPHIPPTTPLPRPLVAKSNDANPSCSISPSASFSSGSASGDLCDIQEGEHLTTTTTTTAPSTSDTRSFVSTTTTETTSAVQLPELTPISPAFSISFYYTQTYSPLARTFDSPLPSPIISTSNSSSSSSLPLHSHRQSLPPSPSPSRVSFVARPKGHVPPAIRPPRRSSLLVGPIVSPSSSSSSLPLPSNSPSSPLTSTSARASLSSLPVSPLTPSIPITPPPEELRKRRMEKLERTLGVAGVGSVIREGVGERVGDTTRHTKAGGRVRAASDAGKEKAKGKEVKEGLVHDRPPRLDSLSSPTEHARIAPWELIPPPSSSGSSFATSSTSKSPKSGLTRKLTKSKPPPPRPVVSAQDIVRAELKAKIRHVPSPIVVVPKSTGVARVYGSASDAGHGGGGCAGGVINKGEDAATKSGNLTGEDANVNPRVSGSDGSSQGASDGRGVKASGGAMIVGDTTAMPTVHRSHSASLSDLAGASSFQPSSRSSFNPQLDLHPYLDSQPPSHSRPRSSSSSSYSSSAYSSSAEDDEPQPQVHNPQPDPPLPLSPKSPLRYRSASLSSPIMSRPNAPLSVDSAPLPTPLPTPLPATITSTPHPSPLPHPISASSGSTTTTTSPNPKPFKAATKDLKMRRRSRSVSHIYKGPRMDDDDVPAVPLTPEIKEIHLKRALRSLDGHGGHEDSEAVEEGGKARRGDGDDDDIDIDEEERKKQAAIRRRKLLAGDLLGYPLSATTSRDGLLTSQRYAKLPHARNVNQPTLASSLYSGRSGSSTTLPMSLSSGSASSSTLNLTIPVPDVPAIPSIHVSKYDRGTGGGGKSGKTLKRSTSFSNLLKRGKGRKEGGDEVGEKEREKERSKDDKERDYDRHRWHKPTVQPVYSQASAEQEWRAQMQRSEREVLASFKLQPSSPSPSSTHPSRSQTSLHSHSQPASRSGSRAPSRQPSQTNIKIAIPPSPSPRISSDQQQQSPLPPQLESIPPFASINAEASNPHPQTGTQPIPSVQTPEYGRTDRHVRGHNWSGEWNIPLDEVIAGLRAMQ